MNLHHSRYKKAYSNRLKIKNKITIRGEYSTCSKSYSNKKDTCRNIVYKIN